MLLYVGGIIALDLINFEDVLMMIMRMEMTDNNGVPRWTLQMVRQP